MKGNINEIKNLVPFDHPYLDKLPNKIIENFSALLGDKFHFMDRIKVPAHHFFKKHQAYLQLLAFFMSSY